MASAWAIALLTEQCGNCRAYIAAGDPLLEIRLAGVSGPPKRRCQSCGQRHVPLTDAAIEQAQQARIEVQERQALQHEGESSNVASFANARPVRSFAKLSESAGKLFDPRTAQLSERDR